MFVDDKGDEIVVQEVEAYVHDKLLLPDLLSWSGAHFIDLV